MALVTVRIEGVDGLTRTLRGVPVKIENTLARTVTQTRKQLTHQLQQGMADDSGIRLAVFKKYRIKSFGRVGGDKLAARVWEGYNAIKAGYVGKKPVQEDWGVMVGQYAFRGAFIGKMKSGHVDVFMRRGKGRTPIDVQRVRLVNAPRIAATVAEQTQQVYQDELARQLVKELGLKR